MEKNEVTIIVLLNKNTGQEVRDDIKGKARPYVCRFVEYTEQDAPMIDQTLWPRIEEILKLITTDYVCIVQKSYFDQGRELLTDVMLYENGNQHCPSLMHCHQVGMICAARRTSFDLSCDFCIGRKEQFLSVVDS